MTYIQTDMTSTETTLRARIAELESALRLTLAVSPDDPLLLTPAEQQVAELREALEDCTKGFSRPEGSSLLVRSQVYALLAKLKQGWLLRRKEEG